MASLFGRSAFRATRALRSAGPTAGGESATSAARKEQQKSMLQGAAKRDPELYILLFIMSGAFGIAGYQFARKPTSASSEQAVSMAPGSEPWNSGTSGKYQYHPGGDISRTKDAPSALHSVIIPNVNLPKNLHDQFNKYDKEEFDDY